MSHKSNCTDSILRYTLHTPSAFNVFLTGVISVVCLLIQPSVANTSNPTAHTHGSASLTLVFDNGDLLLEFTTPAANMLGFEHAPKTEAQQKYYNDLANTLKHPNKVITVPPSCKPTEIVVELPFAQQEIHHKNEQHAHHHEHTNAHTKHSDIYSRYIWSCPKTPAPNVEVHYFSAFPNFQTIMAEWIVSGQQGATVLTKQNTLIAPSQ